MEWVDVQSAVPECGTNCLVVTKTRRLTIAKYITMRQGIVGRYWLEGGYWGIIVTHWAPLPDLP